MQASFRSTDAVPLPVREFTRVVNSERSAAEPTLDRVVLVVGEDHTRFELSALLAAQQVTVASFTSAACCLEFLRTHSADCLIVDMHLPDLSGLELQRQVAAGMRLPVIFEIGRASCRERV